MSLGHADLNAIVVDGQPLLLGQTAGGLAVHLITAAVEAPDARPSVPALWLERASRGYVDSIANYSSVLLLDPCWRIRTLCGIEWQAMAAGEGGPLRASQEPMLAPTCRRCLTSLDRWFPDPTPDERIGLLALLIAQAVEEHGSAEVLGVPGDQLKALRAAIRRELRRRLGFDGKTYVRDDFMLVTCDEATERARDVMSQDMVRSMPLGIPDGQPRASGWRLRWSTWSAS